MPHTVARSFVEAFYEAYAPRDPKLLAPFLDDDIDWVITGPVELLQFCGRWRGKAAVLELYERIVPGIFRITSFRLHELLVEGDRAAALCRLTADLPNGRSISYDLAQFLHFRESKIVQYRALIDSFNAAEQVIGHEIDLSTDVERQREKVAVLSDLVAI